MKQIMLDLETLGHGVTAPIVQIAAIEFNDEGKLFETFDYRIDLDTNKEAQLFDFDIGTIEWWLTQSDKARKAVFNPKDRFSLTSALYEFNRFVGPEKTKKIWCHATFDAPILLNAYRALDIPIVFGFRDFMDIRTLRDLSGGEKPPRSSKLEAHEALADCKYQIQCVHQWQKLLREKRET